MYKNKTNLVVIKSGKETVKEEADNVYQREVELARKARELTKKTSLTKKNLVAEYELLSKHYEKLLRQTIKITRISDSTQLNLRKTQDALNHLNGELAQALKKAEDQRKLAEEASLFKTELLSIAAHDLKNPLQSILGFSSLIQESEEVSEEICLHAKVIQNASQRMIKLISELLNTTTIDAGKFTLNRYASSVGELAGVVVAANAQQAQKKQQQIDFSAETNCIADIDAERIREVFDNLISNAIKYSPLGTKITVRVNKYKHPDHQQVIRFTVSDEGQGFTESDKQLMFGKFQRLSAKPTGGESSTGLGLSIAKQLVDLHGGMIWVESAGKDKGATFIVTLPEFAS